MRVGVVSPLVPSDAGARPLAFAPARQRTTRTGVAAIAAISRLRPVEPTPDAQRYADALTSATTYAADARRSAWLDPGASDPFPRSRPAAAALADLVGGDDSGVSTARPGAEARNVTPGRAPAAAAEWPARESSLVAPRPRMRQPPAPTARSHRSSPDPVHTRARSQSGTCAPWRRAPA